MRKLRTGILAVVSCLLFLSGSVDGQTTDKRELKGGYIHWGEQNIAFGERSYYAAPWRSYLDTRDAPSLLNALAINYDNTLKPEQAEAVSQAMEEAGFRSVRLEISWNFIRYDDESRLLPDAEQAFSTVLAAFKRHHLRPLILLNSHSGLPAPYQYVKVTLKQEAKAGDRVIYVKDTSGIRPGYTGLMGQGQAMYPVITTVDAATGKCVLSDALKAGVAAGSYDLIKLKYQPFSGSRFADGKPNPAAKETIDGWLKYAATVSRFVKGIMGEPGDAGFDTEVWNEYSFGSEFLDINNYYNPAPDFSEYVTYSEGNTVTGTEYILPAEIILPLTANYIKAPSSQLPGVRVISGFSNQRPWDNGTDVWKNQDGFSKHIYSGYNDISSETVRPVPTLNALGQEDSYVPAHISYFPEFWFDAYQTEFLVRDTQPFPGPYAKHYRYANRGDGKEAELWMTETNFVRDTLANERIRKTGVKPTDPALVRLMHEIQAKALLRTYVFFSHKGIRNIFAFAVKFQGDLQFAVIPDSFFAVLEQNGNRFDDKAKSLLGPQMRAISNLSRFMRQGTEIESPRRIHVDKIVEYNPRIVFRGDGTPRHPTRYHADDLAVLPYQMNDRQFAVGYYVMTRNLMHSWDPSQDELSSARYAMPDQPFEITLSNIQGTGAFVSVFDPITNTTEKASVTNASANTLTVKVPTTDYPRFLVVREASPKPLFKSVELRKTQKGAVLTVTPSQSGNVKVTWGKYPVRDNGTLSVKRYNHFDPALKTPVSSSAANGFYFSGSLGKPGESNGYFRFTGKIRPAFSETYTFIHAGDSCETKLYVGKTKIMDGCKSGKKAVMDLQAGKDYDIEMVTFYSNNHIPHSEYLYWFSKTQPFSIVPAKSDEKSQLTISVTKDRPIQIPLPNMKEGDGVKLVMESGKIRLQYPQWEFDVKGVLYSRKPA